LQVGDSYAAEVLSEIVRHLENLLNHANVGDYPGAHNGLQIDNSGRVSRVCAAVDACEAVLSEAARVPGTLLLVHHGLLWDGARPFRGALRRKLKLAFDADLAVFSSHLPLDLHAKLGNNALLARALGLRKCVAAFSSKGQAIGLVGSVDASRVEFTRRIEKAVGGAVKLAPGGPARVRRVGVVTGGAGDLVAVAAALGCDAFVTGEGAHHTYTLAEELGVNLFYGGHYATETFGVKALAEQVARKFRKKWEFIGHPTGL
jgi:dinuclear metal center YbgI/SA1388 family protein